MKDNSLNILEVTLKYFNVSNNKVRTEIRLRSHPDHSTLKSLCDTIEEFGVKTYPSRVTKEQLREIEGNFIAHIREGEDKVCVFVRKYSSDLVEYYSSNKKVIRVSQDKFHRLYTGVVIQLEKKAAAEKFRNVSTPEKLISVILPFTLLGLSLLYIVWQFILNQKGLMNSGYERILIVTKALGLIVTGHLVYRDWTFDTSFTERICKSGKNMDCDSVLKSKFSTVYAWVKWSDLGLIYFVSTFFLVVSGNGFSSVLQPLSLLASLYIFISLYQQAFLIRKWCILCLGVMLLLTVEAGLSFTTVWEIPPVNMIVSTLFYGIISGIVILLLKQGYRDKNEVKELTIKYDKHKRDPEVFRALWQNGQQIVTPDSPYNIIFGNRSKFAPRLTIFLSLTCRYCGETFNSLLPILEKHTDLAVHIIPVLENSKDKIQSGFIDSLYDKYKSGNPLGAFEAMDNWYKGVYHKNLSSQGLNSIEETDAFIHTNKQNAIRNQIGHFPALFFQSKSKPSGYTVEEVLQFKTVLSQATLTMMPEKREMIINK